MIIMERENNDKIFVLIFVLFVFFINRSLMRARAHILYLFPICSNAQICLLHYLFAHIFTLYLYFFRFFRK
jgi:hypothetical protein